MAGKLNQEGLLLSFLYSRGIGESVNEPIAGRTRLVKLMYIFKEDYSRKFNAANFLIAEQDLPGGEMVPGTTR